MSMEDSTRPHGFDLDVSDALVANGRLLIGGTANHEHVIWEADLDSLTFTK